MIFGLKKIRKQLTFDLDTNELKNEFGKGNYTKGYRLLQRYLIKNDFEHRQGSVYCSFKVTNVLELAIILAKLRKTCPWLKTCLRRMDIANVGLLHEVTKVYKI